MVNINNKNYNQPKYDKPRETIMDFIEMHGDKEKILYAGGEDKDFLKFFLEVNNTSHLWDIDEEDWYYLVNEEWEAYIETHPIYVNSRKGAIFTQNEENELTISRDRKSSWQKFKRDILKKKLNFSNETIYNIEKDNENILKNLNLKTEPENPNKGLIIGSVQSGKTTNMAALMAMASDVGFNVFIILSGVIETLRIQTQNRLKSILNPTSGNRYWSIVERPRLSKGDDMFFNQYNDSSNYYMVVLKQVTRLKDLISWLQADKNLVGKLKILVIDDESDQASANTSKDPEYDRKTINRLIVNLVHNKNIDNEEQENPYGTMNYLGYTATPYANILSESPDNKEALYPKNFIFSLSEVDEHFGPKEIFGVLGEENDGINIIREIKEPKNIKEILQGLNDELPKDLKESVCYFIGAAASLRLHNFNKPVSMLVHISNRIKDHNIIFNRISDFLLKRDEVIDLVKEVWEKEKEAITINEISQRVKMNRNRTLIPHDFEDIKEEVQIIIDEIGPIQIDSNTGRFNYHDGIHTIVDHSEKMGSLDEEYRLNYPNFDEDLKRTPIFLVIGGATLSRGITLEGLVSTYFLRTPSSADTLTQMGRWFGYRINYELYPRIWLTNKTRKQFEYISTLEEELREEIETMSKLGNDFSVVGPKIKHSPQFINLTSREKSRAIKAAEYDFSGYSTQTYIFDNDIKIQKENLKIGEKFINSLGKPIIVQGSNADKVFWRDIPFEKIKNKLLEKFIFNNRIKSLNDIEPLIEWLDKASDEGKIIKWSVILGGIGKANTISNNWKLKHVTYNKVRRTKLKLDLIEDINIGVLRAPKDLYGDLNESTITDQNVLDILNDSKERNRRSNYNYVRSKLGLSKVPQLIIYRIDKDSKPRNEDREELGIDSDLLGIYISIPSENNQKSFTTYVTVQITEKEEDNIEENDFDEGEN